MLTARRKNTNYGKVISFGLQKGGVGKTTSTAVSYTHLDVYKRQHFHLLLLIT